MDIFILIVVIVMLVALLGLALVIKKSGKEAEFPYRKAKYFMTPAEQTLFVVLQQVVPAHFYIFSQVSIRSLLDTDKRGKEYLHYFNRISSKSVDFVLVEKSTMEVALVLELDDRSHSYPDRMRRDETVNAAFKAAGVRMLRVMNQRSYDLETVKSEIGRALA